MPLLADKQYCTAFEAGQLFHYKRFPSGVTNGVSAFQRSMGRMTDAFTWPSPLRHFLKCLPNLSSREQPLLLILDVFSVGWVA